MNRGSRSTTSSPTSSNISAGSSRILGLMRSLVTIALGAILLAAPVSAEVQVTIADGAVTLSAKNATVSQILAEWAKVGQTRIINGERVTGLPLTLELTKVPEAQALDIILRSVGGYVLA